MKANPRSRSRPAKVAEIPAAPTDAQILALFRKAEAAWKLSRSQLEAALETIAGAATAVRSKPATRRGTAFAKKIEAEIALVRSAVENDNAADAAVLAIRLAETWLRFTAATTSSRSGVPRRSR